MPDLTINGVAVSVEDGATVLDAAEALQIEIPTLCHLKGSRPQTSCMICVVKNTDSGQLIPACSAKAVEGMKIETECEEVLAARRDVLNLLLSEHVGDCVAPCQRICPAHLDIPLMLREMERGNLEDAGWIARRDLAIPVALGHLCPAPCEKGCRRAQVDTAITILTMHRQAAENFQGLEKTFPRIGKTAAVIGSGAAGLSCAWKLLQLGWVCTVFDEAAAAGGSLRDNPELPEEILDAEIEWLRAAGIRFELNASPDAAEFDAVVAPEEHKIAVLAVAKGKAAALEAAGAEEQVRFDSRIGSVRDSEAQELSKAAKPFMVNHDEPQPNSFAALEYRTAEQGMCNFEVKASASANNTSENSNTCSISVNGAEAARCLHCDCRKPESCKLRAYAERYGANQREYRADERGHVQVIGGDGAVMFEPGKCIRCGLCIEVSKREGAPFGLAFVGRGIQTRVQVPFHEALEAGLEHAAKACVEVCPTGALAFRDAEERPGRND